MNRYLVVNCDKVVDRCVYEENGDYLESYDFGFTSRSNLRFTFDKYIRLLLANVCLKDQDINFKFGSDFEKVLDGYDGGYVIVTFSKEKAPTNDF